MQLHYLFSFTFILSPLLYWLHPPLTSCLKINSSFGKGNESSHVLTHYLSWSRSGATVMQIKTSVEKDKYKQST